MTALPTPDPITVAAGSKILASDWNADVRDAILYLLGLQGGVGRRNILTNSHMDIWQRGTSFAIAASTKTYTADRWAAYRTATGSTVSRQAGPTGQSYGLRYQRDPGNTSTADMSIMQAATTADSMKLAGRLASLKLNLAAGANFSAASALVTVRLVTGTGTDQSPEATWTGTADALNTTQAITTTPTDYTFDSITIPANATQIKLVVSYTPVGTAGANDWMQLAAGQVSAGSASGYERLPVTATLAECRNYFRIVDDGEVSVAYNSATSIIAWARFDPPMRIAPSPTYPSGTWSILVPTAKTSTNAITPGSTTTNSVLFSHGGFAGLTAAQGGYYDTVPGSGIFLDAEL